jgi:hypothetical protein
MSIEGVWKVEAMGPYGWERIATAFLKDGRYLGASADHYSTGSYELADDVFTADLHLHQHGKVRAVYGTKKKEMDTRLEGNLKKEGKIVGRSQSTGNKKFEVKMRLIRLGDLD